MVLLHCQDFKQHSLWSCTEEQNWMLIMYQTGGGIFALKEWSNRGQEYKIMKLRKMLQWARFTEKSINFKWNCKVVLICCVWRQGAFKCMTKYFPDSHYSKVFWECKAIPLFYFYLKNQFHHNYDISFTN